MVEENIFVIVSEVIDWVLSMVIEIKFNKFRICIDFKDLNRVIKWFYYIFFIVEEVVISFSKVKVFFVLDVKSGFW